MIKPKIKIELIDYMYNCADECCTNIGTITKVNNIELPLHNQDTLTIVKQILEHIGYDVDINYENHHD